MVPQRKAPGVWWLDENGKPNDAEPSIRGQATLNRSAAEALFAGAPQSLEEVFAAAEASRPQAFPLAVEARLRVSGRHIQLESPNVAAVLRGSDAQLRNEYVVYTAHLDHLGICRPAETDAICNGAYDNASGVAMMLEVARAFARLPLPPKRSMIFLAVTGEEKGLLGSDYFAHYPTVPPAQIVANINIDEPPLLYPLRDIVAFGAEDSSLGTVVAEAAARLGVALSPDPMPEEVLFVRSDQFSFVRQGVPAVFLFQGFQSSDPSVDGRAVFERWERERYHAPGDDASQPFDFATGVKAAQLNFLIGYQVARQTERPAWKPGDFFGEKFGRRR
jgi:Zn-dependent M28 family amino/carboxypeptidase